MANVFSVLEVSRSHLPRSLRERLTLEQVTADPLSYGWIVFVPPQTDGDGRLHPALQALFAHARRYRCRYVIVDFEAEGTDPDLPVYDE